jgi:hypothetical protein
MVRLAEIVNNSKDAILATLHEYFSWEGWTKVDDDGLVSTETDIGLRTPPPNGILPVKFDIVGGHFRCAKCELVSLEGSPRIVGGAAGFSGNKLTSLKGGPQHVERNMFLKNNPLTSLEGLPETNGVIILNWSRDLPLLRLVGRSVTIHGNEEVETIFDDLVGKSSRRDIIECQKQLIAAGFEGNASW